MPSCISQQHRRSNCTATVLNWFMLLWLHVIVVFYPCSVRSLSPYMFDHSQNRLSRLVVGIILNSLFGGVSESFHPSYNTWIIRSHHSWCAQWACCNKTLQPRGLLHVCKESSLVLRTAVMSSPGSRGQNPLALSWSRTVTVWKCDCDQPTIPSSDSFVVGWNWWMCLIRVVVVVIIVTFSSSLCFHSSFLLRCN